MLSAFKIIIFAVTLLFPLQSVSAQGGQVILDIKESPAAEMIDYPGLYKEYLREIDAFDEKYPGSQIEEDFVDDILSLHPDYTDEQAATKAGLLRLGIRGRRTYRFWEAQVKEFLLKNDIPLYFADDQYEMGGPEEYQKSDLCLQDKGRFFVVPLTGLEPVWYFYRGILSPLCLPISPQRHKRAKPATGNIIYLFWAYVNTNLTAAQYFVYAKMSQYYWQKIVKFL